MAFYRCGSGGGTDNVIVVHPQSDNTQYPYVKGVSTWVVPKPRGKSVKYIMIEIYSSSSHTSGTPYSYYINEKDGAGYYAHAAGSTSAGHIRQQAYPATSNNRLGFSETDTEVAISFYENVATTGRVTDLIVILE
jgi:hypothetical protein